MEQAEDKNVFGEELERCSLHPLTGYFRNGGCSTGSEDHGTHTVCAIMTDAFLDFSRNRGNDLMTPRPEYDFPGLNAGDQWCLCALRWKEAWEAGCAPFLILEATHEKTLHFISLDELIKFAFKNDSKPGN
jgi:uncharacterized protein (DUF2237 family)